MHEGVEWDYFDKFQKIIDKYDFKLNVNKKVKELTVGQQQKIEILKDAPPSFLLDSNRMISVKKSLTAFT